MRSRAPRWLIPSLLVAMACARPTAAAADEPTTEPAAEPSTELGSESATELGAEESASSKKRLLLEDKQARAAIRAQRVREAVARPFLTVRNIWTRELLPLDPARPPDPATWNPFLRDHFTNQAAQMDPRLLDVVLRAAGQFKSQLVEVVSAYRSDKYNLMLRKKGHAVARESQHPLGHAIDFRVAGVATRKLYRFVRSLRLGGAGYYPHTGFVHADVGRVRTWVGN